MEETTLQKVSDIALDITWSKIAKRYFDRSSSWIYNKLREIDGNGGKGGFTPEERIKLKEALYDLADRIKVVADKF